MIHTPTEITRYDQCPNKKQGNGPWWDVPSDHQMTNPTAGFLNDLENHRANGARSRNLRLTAIRPFFRYAALEVPHYGALIQRVLAIPNKRQPRPLVDFLTQPELKAVLAAPNRNTWLGRRDHALLLTAVQTGLRLSEITSLRQSDVLLCSGAHVRCQGKGRKERCTPLQSRPCVCSPRGLRNKERMAPRSCFPARVAAR